MEFELFIYSVIEGATDMSESFSVGSLGPYGSEENAVSWDVKRLSRHLTFSSFPEL